MHQKDKRFTFQPLWTTLGLAGTVISVSLPAFEWGLWLTEHMPFILWLLVGALVIAVTLLVARVSALKERLSAGQETTPKTVEQPLLSPHDREIARTLWSYASDEKLLDTLGNFFPYQISRRSVSLLERLSGLPQVRAAHDEQLQAHFQDLSSGARDWLELLLPLIEIEGDFYSTRLKELVSQDAYKYHSERTDELGESGFALHEKLLSYQRYFSSLHIEPIPLEDGE